MWLILSNLNAGILAYVAHLLLVTFSKKFIFFPLLIYFLCRNMWHNCLDGDVDKEKFEGIFCPYVCFAQIDLMRLVILDLTEYWLNHFCTLFSEWRFLSS